MVALVALGPWLCGMALVRVTPGWCSGSLGPASAHDLYKNSVIYWDLQGQNAPWLVLACGGSKSTDEHQEGQDCELLHELGKWPRTDSAWL